jgi:methyl halide transferase
MNVNNRFKERYKAGDTPWDIGKPDFNLIQTVTSTPVAPRKALDIGCGTGDNAIWLAKKKFHVVGIDISEIAIKKAEEKALKNKVDCTFIVTDILSTQVEGKPFGFAFDRGCFHALSSPKDRKRFAENVSGHLEKDGTWLSLIGNADEQRQSPGPPQRTARDIVTGVESHFEILALVSSYFGSNRPNPPRAWVCLMRKRR